MAIAPYGVRLLVGAAATVVEETRKLPQTLLMYPMTLASQAARWVMKLQQNIADLVIKGDETLESMFPPKDEQPEWATFDEDIDQLPTRPLALARENGERLTEGRFALYSDNSARPESSSEDTESAVDNPPDVAIELDYENLTLAQLRARLLSLSVDDLDALLAYEVATKARAPFQTLVANRIARATAK